MRRFLVFSPLFAIWFLTAQIGLYILNILSFWITMWIIARGSSSVRFTIHPLKIFAFWSPQLAVRACILGAIIGALFALLALRQKPSNGTLKATFASLLSHLLKSGVVAVGLILLYYGAVNIPLQIHLSRTPAPAYTPHRAISQWCRYVPELLLFLAVLWSMRKTLHRTVPQAL